MPRIVLATTLLAAACAGVPADPGSDPRSDPSRGEVALATARRYLGHLHDEGVDTLVLGCTHYPLLKGTIGAVMGPEVQLVDSAESVAAEVCARLGCEPGDGQSAQHPPHRFFVTDVPGPFQQVAERFLGRSIRHLERV